MKRYSGIIIGLIMVALPLSAFGITVAPFDSASNLANSLLGPGMTMANVTYSGANEAAGYFSGAQEAIGIGSGIVLCSGRVSDIWSSNTLDNLTWEYLSPGDSQLDGLIPGYSTNDAAILEFDFTTSTNAAYFTYVFASEEYNEWVDSEYNDVFGFFLENVNHAVLPSTTTPISVNTVNPGLNAGYFIDNTAGAYAIEFDGYTIPLIASFTGLTPYQTYHLKLAIADAGDYKLDSAVFIKASSFTPTVPIPAAFWLLGTGLLGLLGMRKKWLK